MVRHPVLIGLLAVALFVECHCAMMGGQGAEGKKQLNMALVKAATDGDVAKARELLAQGADARTPGPQGLTPLHHAAYSGNVEMADLLISRGADVNAKSWAGRTPLFLATSREMKALLQEHGAK